MDNFEFLGPNLPKNKFWGQNFKNPSLDSESASLTYYDYQFLDKTDNFDFFGPNLPKNGFTGWNFKNLSLDSESGSLRYWVHQFPDKTDSFEFLGPNLPKNGSWGRIQNQNQHRIQNQHLQCTMCANFQSKWTTFNFVA